MLSDDRLTAVADRLVRVGGMVGVALGGSRARSVARPDSDVDLGLYYRGPLDVSGLRKLAAELATDRDGGATPELTEPGGWGRWVDGGGWLTIDGVPVDWLYRDLDRVAAACAAARRGALDFGFQVGHPFGFAEVAYAGELALGRVLADPSGELGRLRAGLYPYPDALAAAFADRLDEARFLLGAVTKSARRGDLVFVAGTLFRAVGLAAHAVAAVQHRWMITEKGLVDEVGALPGTPAGFAGRARAVLSGLTDAPDVLGAAVEHAVALVAEADDFCRRRRSEQP